MTSATDDLRLSADFAPATYDDWRKLVDGVLKGAPFEKLVGKTYDGLKIDPIYPRARGAAPIAGRPAAAPWQIMQRIDHPDAAQANGQALHDLENGATGLELEFVGLAVVDADPQHVAGQQVGRELNATESAIDAARQRAGQHGLTHARNVLDQHVPLRAAPVPRNLYRAGAREELAGERRALLSDLVGGPLSDHVAAVLARTWAHVHEVVGRAHRALVVLDHEHGVTQVAEPLERRDQLRQRRDDCFQRIRIRKIRWTAGRAGAVG